MSPKLKALLKHKASKHSVVTTPVLRNTFMTRDVQPEDHVLINAETVRVEPHQSNRLWLNLRKTFVIPH